MPLEITSPPVLDDATQAELHALIATLAGAEDPPPLNDDTLARLGSRDVQHLLAREDGALVGYAQRDENSAELAADPTAAAELLGAVEDAVVENTAATDAAGEELRVWSHGRRSPLAPVLAARGYSQERVLHQLRRSLAEPAPDAPLPAGVTVRAFVVGADEDAWLRVNAAAFATHPEQGGWTLADVTAREAEPWFDPQGFMLALRGDELLGFHWTKIHPDGAGEVYVIGVAPATQGMHLGPALLALGLDHLRAHGCPEVLLYVDDSNAAAMRLYERFGFRSHEVDVQWRAPH